MPETTFAAEQIVEIPIELIRENPDNPRGPMSPEDCESMSESLKAVGQRTAVRVRPQSEAEKVQFPPTQYLLLGGHRRMAGAKLAGLKTLKALIVTPRTPYEEVMEVTLDNQWSDIGWWKKDLLIGRFLEADPKLEQQHLAAQLGCHKAKISRAIKILETLTPAARDLVDRNQASQAPDVGVPVARRNSKNKVFLITESLLLVLADLGDPQEVEKALHRVLHDQMTESQVRQMVAVLKNPSSHPLSPSSTALKAGKGQGASSNAQTLSEVDTSPIESAKRKSNPKLEASSQVPLSSRIGVVITSNLIGKSIRRAHAKITNKITTQLFPRFFRMFDWVNNWVQKRGVRNPVYATVITAFLILFASSFLIGKATRLISRTLVYMAYSRMGVGKEQDSNTSAASSSNPPATGPVSRSFTGEETSPSSGHPLSLSGTANPSGIDLVVPEARGENGQGHQERSNTTSVSNESGAPQQWTPASQSTVSMSNGSNSPNNLNVLATAAGQVQGVSMNGNLESNSVSLSPQWSGKVAGVDVPQVRLDGINLPFGGNSSHGISNPALRRSKDPRAVALHEPPVPEELEQRVNKDKDKAQKLTKLFYAFSYKMELEDWRERFDCLAQDYDEEFDTQYFSNERRKEFNENKMYFDFDPSGPPKLVRLSDTSDDVRIEGIVTLRSDAVYPKKLISKKRKALIVTFFHKPDNSWTVTSIKETLLK